jgi:hypothetical protein
MSTSFMSMVLVACLATTASAQSLSVRITDDKGEPIWGAALSWRPIANAQWTAGIRSDSAGRVGVQPGPGRVILTAHAIGFFPRSDTVMVTNGEAADHQMPLRRQRWIPFVGVHVGGPAVGSLAIGPAVLTRPAGSHPPRTRDSCLPSSSPASRPGGCQRAFFRRWVKWEAAYRPARRSSGSGRLQPRRSWVAS